MVIYYNVTTEEHCDLDIEKLVEIIIDNYGTPDPEIMDFWGDNMEAFLIELGFHNYDDLNDDSVDGIYDTVCDKLTEIVNGE